MEPIIKEYSIAMDRLKGDGKAGEGLEFPTIRHQETQPDRNPFQFCIIIYEHLSPLWILDISFTFIHTVLWFQLHLQGYLESENNS